MARVRLVWTCDNEAWIYLDGKLVDHDNKWERIKDKTIEMSPPREIRVVAKNYGGPAGFALIVEVDGRRYTQTDASWRTADGRPVYVIPHDFNPWGNVGTFFRNYGAEWIWSSKEGAEGKKDFEAVFVWRAPAAAPTTMVAGVAGAVLTGLAVGLATRDVKYGFIGAVVGGIAGAVLGHYLQTRRVVA